MGGGSETDIAKMLDAHYAGEIDIADYWAVGDTRTESITEIPSGTTEETQAAQDIELVIIGMNHDDKSDESGKAAVTVQTKNQLGTAGKLAGINSYRNHWDNMQRRSWCNNDFKAALPTWLQDLIKPVTKITNRHASSSYSSYRNQSSTVDETFILSEYEIFGSNSNESSAMGILGPDGTQYEYMKTQSNHVKSGPSSYWWTRTNYVGGAGDSGAMVVNSSGNCTSLFAYSSCGVSPAFCL